LDVIMNTDTASLHPDPVIVQAVETVSNPFGVQGLCDLIALAREELGRAEQAIQRLQDAGD
jgi:hypothetical protein